MNSKDLKYPPTAVGGIRTLVQSLCLVPFYLGGHWRERILRLAGVQVTGNIHGLRTNVA